MAGDIAISIYNPTALQLNDSVLSISVYVNSTYSLSSVTASVNGRQVSLTAVPQWTGSYQGTLSLSGFNQDTLTLQVLATDVQNNKDSASRDFIYDKLPILAIIQPLNYSVARPTIHIKARCVDKDTCTISVTGTLNYGTIVYSGSFVDSVDTTIDLSKGEGGMIGLSLIATDKYGRSNAATGGYVFVESSPYLQKVYESNNLIIDFNFNKALSSGNSIGNQPVSTKIVDITTGDSTAIPSSMVLSVQSTYLTPSGAIYIQPGVNDTIYELNSGSINMVGQASGGSALQSNGKYSLWAGSNGTEFVPGLVYRDHLAGTSALISTNTGINNASDNGLSANGTAAWSSVTNYYGSLNVSAYHGGNTTLITNDNSGTIANSYISTDGTNFLYDQFPLQNFNNNSLHLFDGQKDTLLSLLDGQPFMSDGIHQIYQVNNNYLVFPKKDSVGLTQLWLKDSLGNYSKVTSFGSYNGQSPQVRLDLLNPHGDLVFYANNLQSSNTTKLRRYFESKGQIQEICSGFPNNGSPEWCNTYYVDSSWYISVGRDLFRINTNITPNTVENSAIAVKKDSVYPLSNTQFIGNFAGSGQLIYVTITSLPSNGQLTFKGAPVTLNSVIVRADLSQLSYTPNAGFTGMDSIAWNGSNGISYASSAGIIAINVTTLTAPQKPVLSSLNSNYCNNQGALTMVIDNMPAGMSGTTVQAKLDSSVLPIAVNGSLSFKVDSLSPGMHTLSVMFSNAAGVTNTIDTFNVLAAVTPILNISSSDSLASPGGSSITITASHIEGGGTDPQYIFATDRAFSNILQQSSSNTFTLPPSALTIGINWVYVQMKTSDSCYTAQSAIDSVKLILRADSSATNPANPVGSISIYPNPFDHQFTLSGLTASKAYGITLTDVNGKQLLSQSASGIGQWQSGQLNVPAGIYLLRLYDKEKNKVIGVITVMAK